MERVKKILFYGGQVICGALIAAGLMAAVLRFGNTAAGSAAAPEAERILQSLENGGDPASIDRMVESREESRFVEEERSRILAAAAEGFTRDGWQSSADKDKGNGDKGVWAKFKDYVLLGDSRAVGFSYYGFLESRRVLAQSGATILSIPAHYGELKSLNPAYVIFCFGLNDAESSRWPDGEKYAEDLMGYIEEIREFLPDAKFIVSSVLPTTNKTMERSPQWKRLELYNASLQVVCPEHDVVFVNNDGISAEYIDTLWAPDGVHVDSAFYVYWANNIFDGMMRSRAAAAGLAQEDEETGTAAPEEDEETDFEEETEDEAEGGEDA